MIKKNLEKNNFEVDYIFTHQPPKKIINKTSISKLDYNEFTDYLENIDNVVKFDKWFFGHVHLDNEFDYKHRGIYYDLEILKC